MSGHRNSTNGHYYDPDATLRKLSQKFIGPGGQTQYVQGTSSSWFDEAVERRTRPSAQNNSNLPRSGYQMPTFQGTESEKYKQAMTWCKQFITIRPEAAATASSDSFEFMPYNKNCYKCGKSFTLRSHYMIHNPCYERERRNPPNPEVHQCTQCHRNFKDKDHLRAHIAIHFDPQYKCRRCGKLSHTQFNALTHEKNVHSNLMPFVCNAEPGKCSKEFKCKDRCQRHILGRHFSYHPFICTICGKGCVTADRKRAHEKKRHGNNPEAVVRMYGNTCMPAFEGSEEQKYKQAMGWVKQFIIQRPDSSMPNPSGGFEFLPLGKTCKSCNQKFDLRSYYVIHDPCYQRARRNAMIPDDHHECETCHRVFKDKDHLRAHVTIHYDPQYRCRRQGCGKLSHTQFNALTHEKNIHSNWMPFICNFEPAKCSKEFKNKDRCQRHILGKHFNYHPFTCSICGVGSVTADRKRIHEKRHLNPKQKGPKKNSNANGTVNVLAAPKPNNSSATITSAAGIVSNGLISNGSRIPQSYPAFPGVSFNFQSV